MNLVRACVTYPADCVGRRACLRTAERPLVVGSKSSLIFAAVVTANSPQPQTHRASSANKWRTLATAKGEIALDWVRYALLAWQWKRRANFCWEKCVMFTGTNTKQLTNNNDNPELIREVVSSPIKMREENQGYSLLARASVDGLCHFWVTLQC